MTKKISLTWEEDGVTSLATLLEARAPKTCEAIWDALCEPATAEATHAMYAGMQVGWNLPLTHRNFDPHGIPPEHRALYFLPGEVAWIHIPGNTLAFLGEHDEIWEIAIWYGREGVSFYPGGWTPVNVFALITENLQGFAEMGARVHLEGRKRLTIARHSEP